MAVTGLEMLLGKLGANAATRAVTSAFGPITRRVGDLRAAKQLSEGQTFPSCESLEKILKSLEPTAASRVVQFVESAEFDNLAFQIATKQLLRTQGEDADKFELQIRQEFESNLRIAAPECLDNCTLSTTLYELIVSSVQMSLKAVTPVDGSGMQPAARAALVRSSSAMASAAVRNNEILRKITHLAEIDVFESEFRSAVHSLHSMMRLPHAGTSRQVPFESLYVEPVIDIQGQDDEAKPYHIQQEEEKVSLADVIAVHNRLIILGNPGGGKSTCTLKLVSDIAAGKVPQLHATIPFLVVLREYAPHYENGTSVLDYLKRICTTPYAVSVPEHAIEYALLNGRAIVFFDGLDELLETADRRNIVKAVEGFANRYPTAGVVVTSRKVGYNEAALNHELFALAELGSFNQQRTEEYVKKWFLLDDTIAPDRAESISDAFLEDSRFVSDLTSNPLMLSLMCGIYAFEGYIPRNRPDVYEKCALLLFERWDKQRGIQAPIPFDAHVQSAIRSIAFMIYTQSDAQTVIERGRLIDHVKQYLLNKRFDDDEKAEQAAIDFIDFCKGRAWVLTDLGADVYGFTHRTFLEFFSASHLVRTNASPEALLGKLWQRIIREEWDVVCQLSIQILGKSVEDGADDFLDQLMDARSGLEGVDDEGALNVLSFAVRTLSFVVPRPQVIRRIVRSVVDHYCMGPSDEPVSSTRRFETPVVSHIIEVTDENRELVSRYLFEYIHERLADGFEEERAVALGLYLSEYAPSSVSPDSIHYWEGQCSIFQLSVLNYLRENAPTVPWMAKELFYIRDIDAAGLFAMHGVEILFDVRIAGDMLIPPLSFFIFHGNSFRRHIRFGTGSSRAFDREELALIRDLLISSRPLQLTSVKQSLPPVGVPSVSSLRERKPRSKLNVDLVTLLSMISDELEEVASEISPKKKERDTARFEGKDRREVLFEKISSMNEYSSQEVKSILERWSRRDLHFVSVDVEEVKSKQQA
ncbi:NACHT domain-containing protein [Nocardia africana]